MKILSLGAAVFSKQLELSIAVVVVKFSCGLKVLSVLKYAGSSNGRTDVSGTSNPGSSPGPAI